MIGPKNPDRVKPKIYILKSPFPNTSPGPEGSNEMGPALKRTLSFHLKSLLLSALKESQKCRKRSRVSGGTDISNYVKNSFHNISLGEKKMS